MHDFPLETSTSTDRERGKVKVSSIEDAREETLLTFSEQCLLEEPSKYGAVLRAFLFLTEERPDRKGDVRWHAVWSV